MGKARGVLRLLVVGTIVAAGLGLATSPAAAAVPALTVTPATGLLDQQIVTVTGTGFAPGERVLVAQCSGAGLDGCNLNPAINTTASYGYADDAGTFSTGLRLSRVLTSYLGSVSCADSGCSIVASGGRIERARIAIDFAPTGTAPPPPDATFALASPDVRAHGVTVSWSGSGYLPWFETLEFSFDFTGVPDGSKGVPLNTLHYLGAGRGAYLALCTSPPDGWAGCERFVGPLRVSSLPEVPSPFGLHETVGVAADGTVSERRELPRLWWTHSGRVDCAVEGCSFALEQDGAPHSNLVDVAWAPEWAPWPSARSFVVEAYIALVGRAPTASERSTAIAGLTDRSLTGFTFLRQLAGRPDARRLAELARLYQAALGRRPDGPGLLFWESELRRTGSMAVIAGAFARSREFKAIFQRVDDVEAVDSAYRHTLGRPPSAAERAYWVGRLQAGMSRTHLIHLFSRTPEFLARGAGSSEAAAVAVALLGRAPSADEWNLGPDSLGMPLSERADEVVLRVLSSDELIAAVG